MGKQSSFRTKRSVVKNLMKIEPTILERSYKVGSSGDSTSQSFTIRNLIGTHPTLNDDCYSHSAE